MKSEHRFSRLSFILFVAISFCVSYGLYHSLFQTFYQQDEWMALGLFFGHGPSGPLWGVPWTKLLIGSGRPLIWPFHALVYTLFPFQIWPLALFSLIVQPIIGVLVYSIILLLTGSIAGAWIGGLFFLLSYNGSQAVSWFATSTITLSSTLFGLISVVLLLWYLRKKKTLYLIVGQLCVLVSYYFKESGIIFALFIPFLYALFNNGKRIMTRTLRFFSPLAAFFFFVVIMVVVNLLTPVRQVDRFVGQSTGGVWKIIENTLFYPMLSFSQVFIPFPLIKKISPVLAEMSPTTDTVFIVLSLVLLLVIGMSVYIRKSNWKSLCIAVVFTLMSFLPYAVLTRGASYLSSRYFYVGVVGAAMLVGIYSGMLWDSLKRLPGVVRMGAWTLIILIMGVYMYKNAQYIQRDIQLQVLDAGERLMILNKIKRSYPVLPNNPVFYVTGDHPGYYFIETQKMPFQQGIGYTFLVWYYPSGRISRDLLLKAGEKFWDISAQGYIEVNGSGFGYYWDKEAMKKDLHDHKFSKNQIIGFYYHSASRELENTSEKIQRDLP